MTYPGLELKVFRNANNWKSYWSGIFSPYIRGSLLEVGAGIGSNTILFLSYKVNRILLLEPDSFLFEELKKNVSLLVNSQYLLNSTIFSNQITDKFDTIIYIDVLEHIENDRAELEQASRILNKGGRIIILAPAHQFLYSRFDKDIGHYRRYNKKQLLKAVPKQLSIEMCKYLDSVGLIPSLILKFFPIFREPSKSSIFFWDTFLIPCSIFIDKLFNFHIGKSIVCVLKNEE